MENVSISATVDAEETPTDSILRKSAARVVKRQILKIFNWHKFLENGFFFNGIHWMYIFLWIIEKLKRNQDIFSEEA